VIGGDSFNEDLPEMEAMVYPPMPSKPRVNFAAINENAEHIRIALRKLDTFDDDAQTAFEALGALLYYARGAALAGEDTPA
jgi:hypothetical protein